MSKLTNKDWELLAPGREFPLGTITLRLRPMGAEELLLAWGAVEKLKGSRLQKGELVKALLQQCPHVVCMAVGDGQLDEEDIRMLLDKAPLKALELVTVLIDLNISDLEGFVKNLIALVGQTGMLASLVGAARGISSSS